MGLRSTVRQVGTRGRSAGHGPPVDDLADDLARILREQSTEEADARLRAGDVLPLRWQESRRGVGDDRDAVLDDDRSLRLDGRIRNDIAVATQQLAAAFRLLPKHRLVVLGEPGAGKTVLALLLQVGLLAARQADDAGVRVPVLIPVSSWDPMVQDLDEFVVQFLATTYYGGRVEVPRRLLAADRLLPILDGLDEIAEAARAGAVAAINRAIDRDRPVVVTCRVFEYEDLIKTGSPMLRSAAVVEVLPVRAEDAIVYLEAVTPRPEVDWAPIFAELRSPRPDSPVARAFSTPLMVSIARTVYDRLGGHPAELLGLGSRYAVEQRLTDRVIDAAYAADGDWQPEQVRRYMTFLSRYLHRHRERDLVWWRMSDRLLSPWAAILVGITAGLLLAVATIVWHVVTEGSGELPGGIEAGAWIGSVVAVLTTLVWYATSGSTPGRLVSTVRGSLGRLRIGFLTGLKVIAMPGIPIAAAVAIAIFLVNAWMTFLVEWYAAWSWGVVAAAVVVGVALAVHRWLQAPPDRAQLVSPTGFLRQDRNSALVGSAVAGLLVGLLLLPGVVLGMVFGSYLTKVRSGWAGWPARADLGDLVSARWRDAGVAIFDTWPLTVGGAMVLPGLVFAMLLLISRAWTRFTLARLVLAARGELPWRLTAFLVDARRRDLLRQAGGAYQFRHVRLQERLAGLDAAPARSAGPGRRFRRIQVAGIAVVLVALAVLPLGLVPRDTDTVTINLPYGHDPDSVTVSPGGTYLATTTWGVGVRLWRLPSGESAGPLLADAGKPLFGNSDRLVVTRENSRSELATTVWRADTGRRLATVAEDSVLVLLAGGNTFGVIDRGSSDLRLFDAEGRQLAAARSWYMGNSISDLGTTFLDWQSADFVDTGADLQKSEIRDLASGKVIFRSNGASDILTLPGGRRTLVVTGKRGAQLYDVAQPAAAPRILSDDMLVGSPVITPSGDRIAAVTDTATSEMEGRYQFRVWDGEGREVATHPLPAVSSQVALTFDLSSRMVVITLNDPEQAKLDLRVHRVTDGDLVGAFTDVTDHRVVEAGKKPVLLVGHSPQTVDFVDVANGRVIRTVEMPGGLPDFDEEEAFKGPMLQVPEEPAPGEDRTLWNVTSGTQLGTFRDEILPSPAGDTFVVRGGDLTVRRTSDGSLVRTLPLRTPQTLAFSDVEEGEDPGKVALYDSAGRYLATRNGMDEAVEVWNARTGCLISALTGHSDRVTDMEFADAPDGRTHLVTGALDGTVRIWRIDPGRERCGGA
ncbi:WD40 repeat domain-containing protein [Actinoplanes sp. DH11]|uniref:NACHT and WD40 repeat domain-containing protein n=1 Tax=Actinoplanes sp. DH11 TaxID=2857011 RepID=UPI001E521038|nr:WD40 repeat domain-containing protein [Actinoplanes sp. DH11]